MIQKRQAHEDQKEEYSREKIHSIKSSVWDQTLHCRSRRENMAKSSQASVKKVCNVDMTEVKKHLLGLN